VTAGKPDSDGAEDASPGYQAVIPMPLLPDATAEELDDCYERIRFALHDREDEVDPPLTVTLCRRAEVALGDEELSAALEICRDAMVDVLGVSADEPGVEWLYRQSTGSDALMVTVAAVRQS